MTPYDLAQRFVGEIVERPGTAQHPFIQWGHSLCGLGEDVPDEVPWCSSFLNTIAWQLRLPRSKSAAARSWLKVGMPIRLQDAAVGYDVVVLNRGGPKDAALAGPGHVGLFAGLVGSRVSLLAGNQGNGVSVASFRVADVLGVRRLSA